MSTAHQTIGRPSVSYDDVVGLIHRVTPHTTFVLPGSARRPIARPKNVFAAAAKTPVDQAASWANAIVLRECRGPGDLPNAMDRIARRYGVPKGVLWSLRYRKPSDISASAYLKLRLAHHAEIERHARRLEREDVLARLAGAKC